LATASILGHTTANSIRLWTRVLPARRLITSSLHAIRFPSLGLPKIEATRSGNPRAALIQLADGAKAPFPRVVAIDRTRSRSTPISPTSST
jgi:hypothetical protein